MSDKEKKSKKAKKNPRVAELAGLGIGNALIARMLSMTVEEVKEQL